MEKQTSILLAAIFAVPLAFAQKPAQPPVKSKAEYCQQATAQVEHMLKEVAYEKFSGVGDNSAPRETNRMVRVMVGLQTMEIQLQAMQAMGCAPYARWVNPAAYATAALTCHATGGRDIDDKCKLEQWARDPEPFSK